MVLINLFNKSKFFVVHLLFWVVVWFFYVYFLSYNSTNSRYISWFSSFLLPVTMVITYFVIYYLIPKYLLVKKYALFILYSFYTLVFSTYLIVVTIIGSFIFLLNLNINDMPPMGRNYIFILILVYLIVGLVSFVSLLKHNFNAVSKNKELQNKILETQLQIKDQELHYLKKQIHPHFLFNTLNTIYGFALKQSKDTPEIILKLSNLLDYILYQVNKPKVSLKEEVLHIQEYIELEKIRFQDTLKVKFKSDVISENILVAPMLLIPFVENAFKHGNIVDGFLTVEVEIKIRDNQLDFYIRNTVLNNTSKRFEGGIGLENIQKRLDLLYPNSFQLNIESTNNWFNINLIIKNLNA